MRKVISFELKKLVSRIGIYILALLMAGLIVASVFIYDPINTSPTNYSLIGETVNDVYENFNEVKNEYTGSVENAALNASTYIPTSSNYVKYNNSAEINSLYTTFNDYCTSYHQANATVDQYNILLVGIRESLNQLKSALDNTLQYTKNGDGYYMLVTNKNYIKLYSLINDIAMNFDAPISHKVAGEKYYNEYRSEFSNCLNSLIYPNLSKTAQKYATNGTYYSIISLRMDEIAQKIELEHNKVVANPNLNGDKQIISNINTLFNRFVNCSLIFEQSYNNAMCTDALYSVKSKTDRNNLVGYSDVSLYEIEELKVKNEYYIEHHSNPNDFANSLSITHTSNSKINAYDFSFFVMSIFAVIVIVFAIYLSAHTISGEINNNTMRFTALRPIKRSSLFFGKYFAIAIMSFILLLFGTITSFITGGILYGFNSANILMTINSSFVLVAHPTVVLGIFVISLLLLTMFYSALTMMLSALVKSDLLAMIIGIIIYIVNLILPLFFGAGSWLRFYPGTNMNLFAYFGTTRISADSILAKLFNNVVYHGMNLWISLIYIIGINTILLIIGKTIFKKR